MDVRPPQKPPVAPRSRGLLVYWIVAALCASVAVVLSDLLPDAGPRPLSTVADNHPR